MTWLGRSMRLYTPVGLAPILIVIQIAFLIGAAVGRQWPVDRNGHPVVVDYLGMWAAGRLALVGHAAAAYDWVAHKAAEAGALGGHFGRYLQWFYPPPSFV